MTEALRQILYGDRGLRSLWRVVAFNLLTAASAIPVFGLIAAAMYLAGATEESPAIVFLGSLGSLVWLMIPTGIAARAIDHTGWRAAGLGGPTRRALGELFRGFAVGILALLPGLVLVHLLGRVVFIGVAPDGALQAPVGWVFLLVAASFEELAFRGYAFLWLARAAANGAVQLLGDSTVARWAPQAALAVGLSALFALAHAANPAATPLSAINTGIAGLWLSLAALRTRSLWVPIGLHWGWNWGQGVLFGLQISGYEPGRSGLPGVAPLIDLDLDGPMLISGSGYGLEGSLGGTVALLIATVGVLFWPRRAPEDGPTALDWR